METPYVNKLRIASVHLSGGLISLSSLQSLAGGIFELPINPEQYARNFKIKYNCPPELGGSSKSSEQQFSEVEPEVLELKFTIDGTGVIPVEQPAIDLVSQAFIAADSDGQLAFVTAKLAQLQLVVYGIQSESHRPPFIVVNWGKLVFLGVLQDMTQTFTLFHRSGLPLRVEVHLKLLEFKMNNAVAAALSLLSPDLTRKRTVKASDNLLTLCDEIYETPHYYLEVAKANGLTNFRKIKAGTELMFPPVAQ
ncbi:hypothetical protein LZD49_27905 [Dyadobacter sp. CY261]|uniref:CIS tube protein n=1 Tax=Dyadobacter sp. CY261 TaxID=2907203 RepID=UPI001F32024B|nr:hypothetical protein [Dyadobacter sp. CY261]MCF0074340.1 hypothetical protein [Dyadobacter sp. CY261]